MARQPAPIDGLKIVPVEGKEFVFTLVDKVTGEPFNVAEKIETAFNAGHCNK